MGLIQALEIENHQKFNDLMESDLLYICYSDRKPRHSSVIGPAAKGPNLTTENGASKRGGATQAQSA